MNPDKEGVFVGQGSYLDKPRTNIAQLDALVAKLLAFEQLPDGWHYGRGSRISGWAAVNTQKIAGIAINNGYRAEVFPGTDQDVLIALRRGNLYYEIIANSDSTISYFLEENGEQVEYGDDLPLSEIIGKLNKDYAFQWSTTASSFLFTGTPKSNDLSVLPSRTHETRIVGEFLLSTVNVQPEKV